MRLVFFFEGNSDIELIAHRYILFGFRLLAAVPLPHHYTPNETARVHSYTLHTVRVAQATYIIAPIDLWLGMAEDTTMAQNYLLCLYVSGLPSEAVG